MKRLDALLVLCYLATGCSSGAIAQLSPETPSATTAEAQQYVAFGGSGYLTEADLLEVQYLAWPQSYDAMKNLLGHPNRRYEEADVYELGNDSTLWVYYQGTSATGYEVR